MEYKAIMLVDSCKLYCGEDERELSQEDLERYQLTFPFVFSIDGKSETELIEEIQRRLSSHSNQS